MNRADIHIGQEYAYKYPIGRGMSLYYRVRIVRIQPDQSWLADFLDTPQEPGRMAPPLRGSGRVTTHSLVATWADWKNQAKEIDS